MNRIKNFFQKKKLEVKFKTMGPGHRLDEHPYSSSSSAAYDTHEPPRRTPTEPNEAQRKAAEAAMSRVAAAAGPHGPAPSMSRSKRAVKDEAKRQLEMEKEMMRRAQANAAEPPAARVVEETALLAVSGVLFTCDLLDPTLALPKREMIHEVERYLRECSGEDPLVTSTIMIYSLNTKEKRDAAIDVLLKYLDNIVDHPDVDTYRRIRLSNKVFQNKVADLKGGVEFLKAVGFVEMTENDEAFLIFHGDSTAASDLSSAKQCLLDGEPVPLKLYRNPKFLKPSCRPLAESTLPIDFFERSAEELRKEQSEREDVAARLLTLRTREMRERDELRNPTSYKYALIRVRFPDNYSLQGTFGASEKLAAVYDFVRKYLELDWAPFALKTSPGQVALDGKEDSTLFQLQLCPAALLYLQWDPDVVREATSSGQPFPSHALKDEFLSSAMDA